MQYIRMKLFLFSAFIFITVFFYLLFHVSTSLFNLLLVLFIKLYACGY